MRRPIVLPPASTRGFQRIALGTVLVAGVAALAVVCIVALVAQRATRQNRMLVTHTYQVLNIIERTVRHVTEAETAQRGFLVTDDSAFLVDHARAVRAARGDLARLAELTSDNPSQVVRAARLAAVVRRKVASLELALRAHATGGPAAAAAVVRTGRGAALMVQVRAHVDAMYRVEEALLRRRTTALERTVAGSWLVTIVTGLGMLALVPVAVAVRRREAQLRAELEVVWREAAMTDALTGLRNRRGFEEIAARDLALARRHRTGAVLYFLDLDDFKRLNDAEGHAAGDRALVGAATALRGVFRDTDVLARIGGDEFVALAVGVQHPGDTAALLAGRVRDALAMPAADGTPGVATSVGYAVLDPEQPSPLAVLLATADLMLGEEKRRRRVGRAPVA